MSKTDVWFSFSHVFQLFKSFAASRRRRRPQSHALLQQASA
jgi:hypothetical protein